MAELRSQGGGSDACVLRFQNERDDAVLVFWIDYEGRAIGYGSIDAGSSVDQSTYTGHAWRLCDETTGMALAEYVGASAIITLQKDGRVRVASTAAATLDGFSAPTAAAAEGEEEEEEGGEEDSEQE